MSELKGQVGELGFTLTVTRKETGNVETFDMVGHVTPEVFKHPLPVDRIAHVRYRFDPLTGKEYEPKLSEEEWAQYRKEIDERNS